MSRLPNSLEQQLDALLLHYALQICDEYRKKSEEQMCKLIDLETVLFELAPHGQWVAWQEE